MAVRIGIDTGGTFTDVVRRGRSGMEVLKVPSTPRAPAEAVLEGLARARRHSGEEVDVVHGTTVGINAVLTGRLPRTALVTNAGFEDLIEVGRQERPELYALEPRRPLPPVPRRLRFGVAARRDGRGRRLHGFGDGELETLRRRLAAARVEAVAVGLLHAPAAPADERAVARALRPLGVPVTCSAELLPRHGEYERFCAALLNAAMMPVFSRYMADLEDGVGAGRLRLMRSSAGVMPTGEVARFPARAAFSGPAGGVLATRQLARGLGEPRAAALDMGGTSTDVCLVGHGAGVREDAALAGLPLPLPTVDVHTVGCGGGSLAAVDAGGALRVGPASAGADPGPACYGVGDRPTVTDAHMVLGHMGARTLLRGAFPVDVDRSVRAVGALGRRLGLGLRRTAEGILAIAETHMMRALLVITVQRAVDPAALPLVAYGGAGGLHAAGLARRLGMRRALVPGDPGAFSAVGLALAGESEERLLPLRRVLDGPDAEREIRGHAGALAEEARTALGVRGRTQVVAGIRYLGQGTSLAVPVGRTGLRRAFERLHRERYGFLPEGGIEVVELRARCDRAPARLPGSGEGPARGRWLRPSPSRRPPCGGRRLPVLAREEMPVGARVRGPCLIEETTGVTRVPEGCEAILRASALELRWR